MCATVDIQTVVPSALLNVKCSSPCPVIAWKDKTPKKQYLIHELCTGLQVKANMFVSNYTLKIGKALHIYIPFQIRHLQQHSGE